MRTAAVLLAVLLLGTTGTAVASSLADEQRDGRAIAGQVRSGATSCDDLTREGLDHVGEYVMWRMLGSTSAHRAMNERMTAMLGATGEARMHQAMGARFLDCTTGAATGIGAVAPMMGGGMMGGAMMGGAGYGWMTDGTWRHMSRGQWRHMMSSWSNTHHDRHHTWGALLTILLISGAIGLILATGMAIGRRRGHGSPPAAPA